MLHPPFNSILGQLFVTGYQSSVHNPSGIIHTNCTVNGSLWVVQRTVLPYSTFRVCNASDFWPFLINVFGLFFDTYRTIAFSSLLNYFKIFSWLNFQFFSKFFLTPLFCTVSSPILFGLTYLYILNSAAAVSVGFWDEADRTPRFNPSCLIGGQLFSIFSFIFFNQLWKQTSVFTWYSLLSYVKSQLNYFISDEMSGEGTIMWQKRKR